MTVEEAIKTIEIAIAQVEWNYPLNYSVAFAMAIEALKEQPRWISVQDRLPECEKPVLAAVKNFFGNIIITKGVYEDGKMIPANSIWSWDEWDEWGVYDEEIDEYYIPEGWFEWNNYSENCGAIDQEVVCWMPLPEPPEEET